MFREKLFLQQFQKLIPVIITLLDDEIMNADGLDDSTAL